MRKGQPVSEPLDQEMKKQMRLKRIAMFPSKLLAKSCSPKEFYAGDSEKRGDVKMLFLTFLAKGVIYDGKDSER